MHGEFITSAKVLIVDDMATNRELAKTALCSAAYQIDEAENGQEALEKIKNNHYDVVLLDVLMPDIDGLDVCKILRQEADFALLPIIMVTSLESPDDVIRGMSAGATDYVQKPYFPAELVSRVNAAVRHKRIIDRLDDIETAFFTLARIIEAKDAHQNGPYDRLAHLSLVFAQNLKLTYQQIDALCRGSILHDIGKLGIPDHILLKSSQLNESEWEIMKQHVIIGEQLCKPFKALQDTVDIIKYHHEAWDGSGYPEGLSGKNIPLLARIFQVVDIYDALSSKRPYKEAFSEETTIKILKEESKKGLRDAKLVKEFIALLKAEPKLFQMPKESITLSKSCELTEKVMKLGISSWYQKIINSS
ncbi:response regulator [Endozoicomonas sp. SM1973]|uniref:Response regulator n=1 Tax=Spartinivicinus marinus TaxID=2994442 RepID=A0A853HSA9_9GAMM|nr:HD domain-containing phosphohydrolase [Spartinivicinus marinus]MCX4030075.1 response regulator [Spartinivicinus marinus]NYZ64680.1 response regulator [Spartinivicinus marinus]